MPDIRRKFHYQAYQATPTFNRGIRTRGRAVERWAFVNVASWVGITPPFGYAPGNTLKRIRDVISGLRRTRGRYSDLTPVQKRKAKYGVRHNQFDVEGLQSLYRYVQTDVGLKFEKLFRRSERTLDAAAEAARTQPYEEGPVLDLEEVQLDNILKTLAELDAEVKRAL